MKRMIVVLVILAVVLGCFGAALTAAAETRVEGCAGDVVADAPQKPSKMECAMVLLLYQPIQEAIKEYYGELKQAALYDAVVTDITQINNNFAFQVTVAVPTFEGAHNHFGLEIMTFAVSPYGVKLVNYVHKGVSD
jgi:sorbitol-specific phosphotransferase system component IIC